MSVVDRIRGALPQRSGGSARMDTDSLADRVDALRRFIVAVEDHIPEPRLVTARTVIDRAGERLSLSREHTVIALAGATGSGKSSIFNAIAQMPLSRVGVRRPTTATAHACVWGSRGAGPLLDWLGVPPAHRFARESVLDGDNEASLRGLVLLDLPDFDSVEDGHRIEVDRLLRLVDLVVWVMDPQKYADRVVHQQYLKEFQRHRDITVVILHQADRLARGDVDRVLGDLRRLLDNDGLIGVPVFATSTVAAPGLDDLCAGIERTVEARQALLYRLAGDVSGAVDGLAPLVSIDSAGDRIDRNTSRRLADALAVAAGVPAVAEATERAYRHRATAALGWPMARWLRKLRPDPLRRLHLDQEGRTAVRDAINAVPIAATSLPEASPAQEAAVALASRSVADRCGDGMPEPWPRAIRTAARSRLADVPDALDVAVASTDLGISRTPLWWRLVGGLQWLGALAALIGLIWLIVRYVIGFLGLPDLTDPKFGALPLPTALLLGGLLFGLLLSIVVRPIVSFAAQRARHWADRRLRAAVADVGAQMIIAPMRSVLRAYEDARAALESAAPRRAAPRRQDSRKVALLAVSRAKDRAH